MSGMSCAAYQGRPVNTHSPATTPAASHGLPPNHVLITRAAPTMIRPLANTYAGSIVLPEASTRPTTPAPTKSSPNVRAASPPRRFWRGPVWVNVNWMVAEGLREHGEDGLAERIALETRRLLEGAGMREHFDPRTGAGLGATDFSWTAALARWWLEME